MFGAGGSGLDRSDWGVAGSEQLEVWVCPFVCADLQPLGSVPVVESKTPPQQQLLVSKVSLASVEPADRATLLNQRPTRRRRRRRRRVTGL